MSRNSHTRRQFLELSSAAVGAALVPAAGAASDGEWTVAETPVDSTLYDVVSTAAGAYAVGTGGVVIERTSEGWRTFVRGGPTGNGNDLYGAATSDDGRRLWFVGASGAIGEYDVETGDLADHSAPMDVTNNFNDVAVTGRAGDADVYVAGDSGKLYYSFENGTEGSWEYVTPGSGSNVNAVNFYGERHGYVVDGNQTVFHTEDGETWERAGIADANVNFYGVDADGADDVWVAGGGGMLHHWNGSGWTPRDTGDTGLRDVTVAPVDDDGLAVGGGGAVYDLTDGVWRAQATPIGENLRAVVRGDPDIAVGASGTVVER
jgi:photosystem II stability/assembly factor-like uncharacterized protein